MAQEIAIEKELRVLRPNREELLSIRRGEVELSDLIQTAELEIKNLDGLYKNSDLPDELDFEFRHNLIVNT